MQTLLDVVQEFTTWCGMEINIKKTCLLVLDKDRKRRESMPAPDLRINGERLKTQDINDACRYLGCNLLMGIAGAICCWALQYIVLCGESQWVSARHSALQRVAMRCCVLQCVEVYCNSARQYLTIERAGSVV